MLPGFEPADKIENLAVVPFHRNGESDPLIKTAGVLLGISIGRLQADLLHTGFRFDLVEILLVARALSRLHQAGLQSLGRRRQGRVLLDEVGAIANLPKDFLGLRFHLFEVVTEFARPTGPHKITDQRARTQRPANDSDGISLQELTQVCLLYTSDA